MPFRSVKEFKVVNDDWIAVQARYPSLNSNFHNADFQTMDQLQGEEYENHIIAENSTHLNKNPSLTQVQIEKASVILNWNWGNHNYTPEQIVTFKEFITSQKTSFTKVACFERPTCELNAQQARIIQLVAKQMEDISKGEVSSIRTVIVQGKAGTGKSTLIHTITSMLNEAYGESSFLLLAPTGVAASNINGSTIHSKLLIKQDSLYKITQTTVAKL